MVLPFHESLNSIEKMLIMTDSGLLVFTMLDGTLHRPNCHLELLIDDNVFSSYTSSKTKGGHHEFNESKYPLPAMKSMKPLLPIIYNW
jgi:hypothetical protein